jgi:hypothetical protein
LGTVLALAPAAQAGTIRFTVPANPAYTVKDNGNGVVKVEWRECLTATERVGFDFTWIVNAVQQGGHAVWNVIKDEGTDPSVAFTPPDVILVTGQDNTGTTHIEFSFPVPSNGVNQFRLKLDPDSGEGLGQGAGIMIRIPCVLQAPPPPPEGPAPGPAGPPPGAPEFLAAPTEGVLPAPTAPQARGRARCVSVPRSLRVRAGERTVIRVRVNTNETDIRNALVRVTGPGFRQTKRTGDDGTVTFFVRPRRRGTITVQSDVCFGADRLRVLGRRRVAAPAPPRFTG